MKIIDADVLKKKYTFAAPDCLGMEPKVYAQDVIKVIDEMPEVEAITVEWLKQKYIENDPGGGNEDYDRYLWDSICYVLTAWREDREVEE